MENYIVIVPATVAEPAAGDYRVVADQPELEAAYKKVFGPDTQENCRKWINEKIAAAAPPPAQQAAAPPPAQPAQPAQPAAPAQPVEPEQPEEPAEKTWTEFFTTGTVSYLLIALGLFVLMFVMTEIGTRTVVARAEDLTKNIKLTGAPAECAALKEPAQKAFINAQRLELANYADSHKRTAIEFYKNFYNTYMILALFGLFAAISLAVIVRKGIDEASPHLITVFLVSTGIALANQGFFGVFQQKENIDSNVKLFVSYAQLNTRIDTYCATGSLPVTDPKVLLIKNLSKGTEQAPPDTSGQTEGSNTQTNTNSPANNSPRTNSGAQTEPAPDSSPTPAAKEETFLVNLKPNEFINYVGWHMEQLKAISIAIDDEQAKAIDSNKLSLAGY